MCIIEFWTKVIWWLGRQLEKGGFNVPFLFAPEISAFFSFFLSFFLSLFFYLLFFDSYFPTHTFENKVRLYNDTHYFPTYFFWYFPTSFVASIFFFFSSLMLLFVHWIKDIFYDESVSDVYLFSKTHCAECNKGRKFDNSDSRLGLWGQQLKLYIFCII